MPVTSSLLVSGQARFSASSQGRREETSPMGADLPFEVSLPVPCHFGEGSGLAEW